MQALTEDRFARIDPVIAGKPLDLVNSLPQTGQVVTDIDEPAFTRP